MSLNRKSIIRGAETLTSATSSVIIASVPVITAILATILFKENIHKLGWAAIAVELAGILLLTLWNGIFSINVGIAWTLCAAVLLSGYNLMQRKLTQKYSALQATTYSIFAGTILLLAFLPDAVHAIAHAPVKQVLVIVYLGIFPSALGYVFWSKALLTAKNTADVTNYMFITPLLSMVMGYIIILEIPDTSTFVGGATILSGLAMFRFVNRRKTIK